MVALHVYVGRKIVWVLVSASGAVASTKIDYYLYSVHTSRPRYTHTILTFYLYHNHTKLVTTYLSLKLPLQNKTKRSLEKIILSIKIALCMLCSQRWCFIINNRQSAQSDTNVAVNYVIRRYISGILLPRRQRRV